jgi:FkbM family methyltransferase
MMDTPPVRHRRRVRRARAAAAVPMASAFVKTTPAYLGAFGFAPDHVFDIGVCGGTPYLYQTFADRHFVLVDPLAESRALIESANFGITFDFHEVALSDEPGTRTLDIPLVSKGKGLVLAGFHSRVDRISRRIQGIEKRDVKVETLDRVAAAYPGRIGLKIDVEGHELPLLRGGSETLARSDFVIVEVSLTERFEATNRPSTLIALLAAAGFELRDVLDTSIPATAAPRHMDLLFTRWSAKM